MERKPDIAFNDPDLENSEQDETGQQAQDVAGEILAGGSQPSGESEDGSPANPADLVPRDVPDLVDNIDNMVRSGRIDMNAFEGEENMDDEDQDEEYTRPR